MSNVMQISTNGSYFTMRPLGIILLFTTTLPRWKDQAPNKSRDQLLEILEDFWHFAKVLHLFQNVAGKETPKQKWIWLLQCEGGLPGDTRLVCVFCFCCCHQNTLAYGRGIHHVGASLAVPLHITTHCIQYFMIFTKVISYLRTNMQNPG